MISWKKSPWVTWEKPENVIGTVVYLASDASDIVTEHILLTDGGWDTH